MEEYKPITKAEFVNTLVEASAGEGSPVEHTKKSVAYFLEGLDELVKSELLTVGKVTIPFLGLQVRLVDVPAKPSRKARNPFTGEQITVGPKPATMKIKIRMLKKHSEEIIEAAKRAKKKKSKSK